MTQREIQQEIKLAASKYNHEQASRFGYDYLTGAKVYAAFVDGANYVVQRPTIAEHQSITEGDAWRLYNFVMSWKNGNYGEVSLQDALDEHYNNKERKED